MAAKKTSKAAKSAEAVVEAAKANIEEAAAAAAETAKEVRKVTEEKVKKVKKAVEPKVKEVKEAAEKKTRTVRAKKEAAPKKEAKKPKHVLTECEVINLKAQKKARELYPDTFTRFGFARLDTTTNKEFRNADDAIRGKADMNNLVYVIKVVEGVQYTGKTRINAYENFLAAVAV